MKRAAIVVACGGTAVALLIIGASLVWANPEQCPLDYTQEQVDASTCIIGANIGLPLFLGFALLLWAVALVIAAALYIGHRWP